MPTIRIDDEVYAWLQSQARPFEDTPNSVLRRIAGLDDAPKPVTSSQRRATSMHVREEKTPQT
jgi:negative regulator of replication initiation